MDKKETEKTTLWERVCKTDPKYTKQANVRGNKITAICPQYQIKCATEQFGIYGLSWGFKCIDLDYSLISSGLIVGKFDFFFPGGSFPIISSIGLFVDNAKTKIDNDFAKKIETDALTKALSKIGFNADVFMGMFDDVKYVSMMHDEFLEPDPTTKDIMEYIDNGQCVDFFAEIMNMDADKQIFIFNDFPKGKKVKYKKKWKDMSIKGEEEFKDLISNLKICLSNNDSFGFKEKIEDMSERVKKLAWSFFDINEKDLAKSLMKQ